MWFRACILLNLPVLLLTKSKSFPPCMSFVQTRSQFIPSSFSKFPTNFSEMIQRAIINISQYTFSLPHVGLSYSRQRIKLRYHKLLIFYFHILKFQSSFDNINIFKLLTAVQFRMRLYKLRQWTRFWLQIVTDGKSICEALLILKVVSVSWFKYLWKHWTTVQYVSPSPMKKISPHANFEIFLSVALTCVMPEIDVNS